MIDYKPQGRVIILVIASVALHSLDTGGPVPPYKGKQK
jgi:hypothetical protein